MRQAGSLRQNVQLGLQVFDAFRSLRAHDPELGHVGADRIADLGILSDKKVPRPVQKPSTPSIEVAVSIEVQQHQRIIAEPPRSLGKLETKIK